MADSVVRYVDPHAVEGLTAQLSEEERRVLDLINQKVAAAQDLESVMSFVFESTRHIFPCDRVAIALLEDGEKRVRSRWAAADYAPLALSPGYSEGIAVNSLRQVLAGGQTRIISDLEAYLRCENPDSNSSRLLIKEGVRSSMTCPLKVEGRSVGFLFRSSRHVDAYDDYQVMLHNQVAERLSQSVEKAYRIEQLTSANQGYVEMLGFASHELKSPLASILMETDLLLRGYLGELQEPQQKHVKAISDKALELLRTTKEYLDLARLEGGRMKLKVEEVEFKPQVLEMPLETLAPQIEKKGMRVEIDVPEPLTVQCDPDLVRTVMLNLIGNAVKYGAVNGLIKVTAVLTERKLRIRVWNEGPGFPHEERDKLFKRFSRLTAPELKRTKGSGIGLYNVWQIVQLHGGHTYAYSEYGKWAEFVCEIPQPLVLLTEGSA